MAEKKHPTLTPEKLFSMVFETNHLVEGLDRCMKHLEDPNAATLAAFCLMHGVGSRSNPQHAFELLSRYNPYLKRGSHGDHPRAKALLAECYIFGKGVGVNAHKGIQLLREAYAVHDRYAYLIQGDCYVAGHGNLTSSDDDQQLQRREAKTTNLDKALKEYVAAGDLSDDHFDVRLLKAQAFIKQARIFEQKGDTSKAQSWLKCAAQSPYPVAWFEYHQLLNRMRQLTSHTYEYLTRAANARYLDACTSLAHDNYHKIPQARPNKRAELWEDVWKYLMFAAEQGDTHIHVFMRLHKKDLKPVRKPAECKEVFMRLKERSESKASQYPNTRVNLGLCYEFGIGHSEDIGLADTCYNAADVRDSECAQACRRELFCSGKTYKGSNTEWFSNDPDVDPFVRWSLTVTREQEEPPCQAQKKVRKARRPRLVEQQRISESQGEELQRQFQDQRLRAHERELQTRRQQLDAQEPTLPSRITPLYTPERRLYSQYFEARVHARPVLQQSYPGYPAYSAYSTYSAYPAYPAYDYNRILRDRRYAYILGIVVIAALGVGAYVCLKSYSQRTMMDRISGFLFGRPPTWTEALLDIIANWIYYIRWSWIGYIPSFSLLPILCLAIHKLLA